MTGTSYKAIRCPCDIRGGEIPNIGSMDKRCALLPGSGEVFGNAYGWKPRPLLATGIVDAGARTIDKMKPAGEGKTWRASANQAESLHIRGGDFRIPFPSAVHRSHSDHFSAG